MHLFYFMKKFVCGLIFIFYCISGHSQSATFITISNTGQLSKVTIGSLGCTSTPLNLCTNFTGSPLSIALDGSILYIVDTKGFLYKSTLTNTGTTGNCTKVGQFLSKNTGIYGLTVGIGGIVYAAYGSTIETYNPTNNTFATLGTMNSQWTIGGDLLFYKGKLFEAVKVNGSVTNNALIEVNVANVSASSLYMNFNAGTSVFGFASVTVPCSNNQAYALSTNASTTDIFAVDMINKTQATTASCTLNYKVNDAASIAETQSATPPIEPTVISPVNYCQNNPVSSLNASVSSFKDTLRWYTQSTGGTSSGYPIPTVSSNTLGTTTYYVSSFDTSTGCESNRDSIILNINPYPVTPTINPAGTNTICSGSLFLFTSSTTSGNQWFLNNVPIAGDTNQTYTASSAGNYTVSTTTNKGCTRTSLATTLNVTNASIAYSGGPFCPIGTKTVTLTGAIGGKFTSSPVGLVIDSITGTLNLGLSQSGNYTVRYTVGPANCVYTTSVSIISQTAAISYLPNTFCQANANIPVTFTSGSVTNGSFSSSPAGLSINANGTINPATSALGTYTVTYTYGTAGIGCGLLNAITIVNVTLGTISTNSLSICSNQLPYSWNGLIFNVTGSQTKHLTNSVGCDSAATLNLTVNNTSTSITNISICPDQLPYSWNGLVFNTAGSRIAHLINIVGCDSAATLNLIVKNSSTSTTNIGICSNQLPYSWNGLTFNSAGSQTKHLTNSIGCDSAATLNLSVTNSSSSITNLNICADQLPYTWNGLLLNTAGSQIAHLINSIGCDSSATLNLTVRTAYVKTIDITGCNHVNYNGIDYKNSTTINDTIKSLLGCDSIYRTINIYVTQIITTTKTTNLSSCKSIVYLGNTYNSSNILRDTVRSYQGCDSIYNITNINISPIIPVTQITNLSACNSVMYLGIVYSTSKILRDTLKSFQGCDSVYKIVSIIINPIVAITQTTNLSACNSLTYLGNTYSSSIILRDTLRSFQGCDSIFKITNISITPIVAVTQVKNLSSCKSLIYLGNSYSSSIILRDTLKSYQGCDSIYRIINITINTIKPSIQTTNLSSCKGVIYLGTTYNSTVMIKDTLKSYQGCDSIYRIGNIVIIPLTTKNDTTSINSCDNVVYLGNTYATSTLISDTIKNIKGCDSIFKITNIVIKRIIPHTTNVSNSNCDSVQYLGVTYTNSTTIIDTTRSFQGCDSIYKITSLIIYPKPVVSKPNDVYILPNTSVTLKISASNNYDYLWYPATYLDDINSQSPLCTPTKDILYKVTVTSQDGCIDTVSQRVIVSKILKIPNVFSPNGDAVNDTWAIDNINTYPRSTVQIFNRYGQLVLSSFPGSYKPWDGKYNGNDLPVGVYYYIISADNSMQPITGSLTLLR